MPQRDASHDETTAEFEDLLKDTRRDRQYVLRLYVTGSSVRSSRAIANIHSLCEEYLPGRYDLKVVDIYQQPDAAEAQQIVAAPTLVKSEPLPLKRVIGDLSNRDKLLVALELVAGSGTDNEDTRWAKV